MKNSPPLSPARSVVTIALSALFAFGGIPASVLAEQVGDAGSEPESVVVEPGQDAGQTTEDSEALVQDDVVDDVPVSTESFEEATGDIDNDELYQKYIQQRFDESLGKETSTVEVQGAEEGLTSLQLAVYRELKRQIKEVAAGTRTSTVFVVSLKGLGQCMGPWTAQDLGVDAVTDGSGNITTAAQNAANVQLWSELGFDGQRLWCTLDDDMPYELYWSNGRWASSRSIFTLTQQGGQDTIVFDGTLAIKYYVDAAYSATGEEGTTEVNPNKGASVEAALRNAQAIVDANSGKSTYDKLAAYKDAICELNTYNYEAADAPDGELPFGRNPYELIWVFDGDSSTNVVCAGYAKAFQYLFDLSDITDAECIYVDVNFTYWDAYDQQVSIGGIVYESGVPINKAEGIHAINVVRMDDGKNYLVDVTNCDDGAVGYPDKLFMKPPVSGEYESMYMYSEDYYNSRLQLWYKHWGGYEYLDDTKALFGEDALTLSSTPYVGAGSRSWAYAPSGRTLEYSGGVQTGVSSGMGYTLTGTTSAKNIGDYVAWARPKAGFVWSDGTTAEKEINWSITRRKVTITANNKSKYPFAPDPVLDATVRGVLNGDSIPYRLSRAGGEMPGTYEIRGQANGEIDSIYDVTFVNGTLTILQPSASQAVASGTWGTCPWTVFGDGSLVVRPGTGEDNYMGQSPWSEYAGFVTNVRFASEGTRRVVAPAKSQYLLAGMYKMTSFDGTGLDTSAADNLSYLFYGCTSLRDLEGVSSWNTSRMETMDKAFANCVSLRTLDLSGWDTSGQSSLGFFAMFEKSFENVSLETFLVGENYRMWGQGWMPDAPTASGWWSTSDGAWYTKDDIVSNRSGIADTYTSTVRKSINGQDVTFGISGSYAYTGTAVRPSVELWDLGYQLREGVDYAVSCRDNVNVGMATVVVKGIGAYVGTRERKFHIAPASLGGAQVTGVSGWTYDGRAHDVSPKVVLGGRTLVASTDYTLEGTSACDAGTYKVTIRGKGNYTGVATATFSVAKATNGMKVKTSKKKVKAAKVAKKKQVVKPLKVSGADGTVRYKRVAKGSSKRLSVNKKTGKVTVKKGTKKGTYKIKVKISVSGDGNHNSATKTVTCKVVVK